MDIILATNNDDKIREMNSLLAGLDITLKTRRDFKSFPDIEETGTTLLENAILKARGIYAEFGIPALADDSGLEVDALNGAPGVFSARYSGPDSTYESNCCKILTELEKSAHQSRNARFRCVIAIAWGPTSDSVETTHGTVEGLITEEFKGASGFGYDPIFYYPPAAKTFAEMSREEKNRVSHRGVALEKARKLIQHRLTRTVD